MDWLSKLNANPIDWLLEDDPENPGVRYLALRDLCGEPPDSEKVHEAQRAVMTAGPVPASLAAQSPEGHWVKPGAGYSPKYTVTT
jgi:hypothetical protein